MYKYKDKRCNILSNLYVYTTILMTAETHGIFPNTHEPQGSQGAQINRRELGDVDEFCADWVC